MGVGGGVIVGVFVIELVPNVTERVGLVVFVSEMVSSLLCDAEPAERDRLSENEKVCVLLAGRLRDLPRVIDPRVHVAVPVWNMVSETLGVCPSGVKDTDEVVVKVMDCDSFDDAVSVTSSVDVSVPVMVIV